MLKTLKRAAFKDSIAVLAICLAFTTIWSWTLFMLAGGSLNSILNLSGTPERLEANADISSLKGRNVTIRLGAVMDNYIGTWSQNFDGSIYYLAVTPESDVISIIADEQNQNLSAANDDVYDRVKKKSPVAADSSPLEITGKVIAITDQTVIEKAISSLTSFIETPDFLSQMEAVGLIKADPVLKSMVDMAGELGTNSKLYAIDTTAAAASQGMTANEKLGYALSGVFFIISLVLFLNLFIGLVIGRTTMDVKKFLKLNPSASMSGLEEDFAGAARITGKFWIGGLYTYWVENTHAYILDNTGIQRVVYFNHNAYTGKGKRRVMKLQIYVPGRRRKIEIPMLPNEAEEAVEHFQKVAPGIEV